MDPNLFKCAEKPTPVFGADVQTDPFSKEDIKKIYHFLDSNDAFVGVFELKDGRFASISHKKQSDFYLDGKILNESMAHVAPSYESIVRLGLTNSTRDVLGI